MLNARKSRAFQFALILAAIGVALVVLPSYRDYCESNNANYYYCAVYEIVAALFSFVEVHNGVFTVIATIAIAWFTLSLREATNKLGSVATDTAAAQERDTQILQRAYLAVEPLGIKSMRSNSEKIIGYVGIKNVGRLPARKVRAFVHIKFANGEDHTDFPLDLPKGSNVAAPGIVLRKASNSLDWSELKTAPKEMLIFYVWGIVYYHDGFVEDRHIRFCHRYRWEIFTDQLGRHLAAPEDARYHDHANGTDEDVVEHLKAGFALSGNLHYSAG
jgi:hypothetical protein